MSAIKVIVLIPKAADKWLKLESLHIDKLQHFIIGKVSLIERLSKGIQKFLNLVYVENRGVSFGMFSEHDKSFYFGILSMLVSAYIIYLLVKTNNLIESIGLSLILGGAIGNFYDRMVYKAVPDFIDFHINDFHWFIFNIADIFISIGVFFMILYEIIDNNSEKNEKY